MDKLDRIADLWTRIEPGLQWGLVFALGYKGHFIVAAAFAYTWAVLWHRLTGTEREVIKAFTDHRHLENGEVQ